MAATPEQTRSGNGSEVLFVDLGSSSLKARFVAALELAGFKTTADGIKTVIRDIVAGRIQYRDGILLSQGESSPN